MRPGGHVGNVPHKAVQLTERGTFPLSARRRPHMKFNSSWKSLFLLFVGALRLFPFANSPVRAQDKNDKDAPYEKIVSIEGITEYRLKSNGVPFLLFPDPAAS